MRSWYLRVMVHTSLSKSSSMFRPLISLTCCRDRFINSIGTRSTVVIIFPRCMYQQLMQGCLCCFDVLKWKIVILWRNVNFIVHEKGRKSCPKVRRGQHTFLLEHKYKYLCLGPQVSHSVLSPRSTLSPRWPLTPSSSRTTSGLPA
jgi:hypothetical protein